MNRRTLLTTSAVAVAASVTSVQAAENSSGVFRGTPVKERAGVWMKQVKPVFAVAYFLGAADEILDKRPNMSADPFDRESGGSLPGSRVLLSESGIDGTDQNLDMANLVARVRQRSPVPLDKLVTLVEAVVQPKIKAPVMECYDPHHIVICYNELGMSCGAVEICLSCNDCRIYPGGDILRTDACDMVKAARVLADVGLPLFESKMSVEDYAKQIDLEIRDVEKWREEMSRKQQHEIRERENKWGAELASFDFKIITTSPIASRFGLPTFKAHELPDHVSLQAHRPGSADLCDRRFGQDVVLCEAEAVSLP